MAFFSSTWAGVSGMSYTGIAGHFIGVYWGRVSSHLGKWLAWFSEPYLAMAVDIVLVMDAARLVNDLMRTLHENFIQWMNLRDKTKCSILYTVTLIR